MNTSLGLGPDPASAATGGNFWSTLQTIVPKVVNTVKTVLPAVQNTKNTIDALKAKKQAATQQGTAPLPATTSPQAGNDPAPAPEEGMSLTSKVLIGLGIAGAIGGGIYLAAGSGGKSLGCPCEENKAQPGPSLAGVKKRKRKK